MGYSHLWGDYTKSLVSETKSFRATCGILALKIIISDTFRRETCGARETLWCQRRKGFRATCSNFAPKLLSLTPFVEKPAVPEKLYGVRDGKF